MNKFEQKLRNLSSELTTQLLIEERIRDQAHHEKLKKRQAEAERETIRQTRLLADLKETQHARVQNVVATYQLYEKMVALSSVIGGRRVNVFWDTPYDGTLLYSILYKSRYGHETFQYVSEHRTGYDQIPSYTNETYLGPPELLSDTFQLTVDLIHNVPDNCIGSLDLDVNYYDLHTRGFPISTYQSHYLHEHIWIPEQPNPKDIERRFIEFYGQFRTNEAKRQK